MNNRIFGGSLSGESLESDSLDSGSPKNHLHLNAK